MTEGYDWRNEGLETPQIGQYHTGVQTDAVNYYCRRLLLTLVKNSERNKVASCRGRQLPSDSSGCSELFQFYLLWPLEDFWESKCRKKSLLLPSLLISLVQHVSPSLPYPGISSIPCENKQIVSIVRWHYLWLGAKSHCHRHSGANVWFMASLFKGSHIGMRKI